MPRKSAPKMTILSLGITALALPLAGCGDRVLETGFGWDYVFEDVEEPDPGPVQRIGDGDELDYPVLGSVPPRPVPPIPAGTRDLLLERLAAANRAADLAAQILAEDAPELPPPEERPTGARSEEAEGAAEAGVDPDAETDGAATPPVP